jgi:hypothetical protein
MEAEHNREDRKGAFAPVFNMAQCVDANGRNRSTADQVNLRREAHCTTA